MASRAATACSRPCDAASRAPTRASAVAAWAVWAATVREASRIVGICASTVCETTAPISASAACTAVWTTSTGNGATRSVLGARGTTLSRIVWLIAVQLLQTSFVLAHRRFFGQLILRVQ